MYKYVIYIYKDISYTKLQFFSLWTVLVYLYFKLLLLIFSCVCVSYNNVFIHNDMKTMETIRLTKIIAVFHCFLLHFFSFHFKYVLQTHLIILTV